MSIFASRTREVVALPFDSPHTVTVQKLSGRHLEKAREASQFASVESLKRLGGPGFQRELAAAGGDDPAAVAALVAKQQANPLNGYDRYVVLQKGIIAWTCVDDAGAAIAVTPEAIDDLSEEAADFLARAIFELTLPARDAAGKKTELNSSIAP